MEADRVSIGQVGGFKTLIESFAKSVGVSTRLQGFIVNNTILSVDDKIFPEQLARSHGARTLGTIPSDRDCIRAYQVTELPTERFPHSDFARYSSQAVEKLVSPGQNWTIEDQSKFAKVQNDIKIARSGRKRAEGFQSWLPIVQGVLALLAAGLYGIYKYSDFSNVLIWFYIATSIFVLWALLSIYWNTLQYLKKREVKLLPRYTAVGAMVGLWLAFAGAIAFDVPKTFSRDQLLSGLTHRVKKALR